MLSEQLQDPLYTSPRESGENVSLDRVKSPCVR